MDAEFVNDPVDRGPELDPSQLILSRNFSFLQLGDAALGLAQLFLRVGEPVLIDGDSLQSRFRDLAAEFGDLRHQRSDLTLDTGLVALQVAKRHFKVKKTVARVNNPSNVEIFKALGVDEAVSATEVLLGALEPPITT